MKKYLLGALSAAALICIVMALLYMDASRLKTARPENTQTRPAEPVMPVPAGLYPALPYTETLFPRNAVPSPHAPSVVELPNGDLFAVWYADWYPKPVLMSARRRPGAKKWESFEIIQRSPGCAVKNPVLYLSDNKKLYLFWGDEKRVFKLVRDVIRVKTSDDMGRTWSRPKSVKGLTWFLPKNHPVKISDGSLILPIYTDLCTSSAVAISKDDGLTWIGPKYMFFFFGIQPTVIERSDGNLYALMRCGMDPRLAWQSTSGNSGRNWGNYAFSAVNNPGTALEMLKLRNGHVVLAYNNSKKGLTKLSLALSLDDGRTWPYIREFEPGAKYPSTYPSIIQDRYGLIHVLYSYDGRSSIAHFVTDEEWIKKGGAL